MLLLYVWFMRIPSIFFLTALLVYENSLEGEFVYDDGSSIQGNADVDPSKSSLWDVFTHNFWGQPYDKKYADHEV